MIIDYYRRRSAKEPLEQVKSPISPSGIWLHVSGKGGGLNSFSSEQQLDVNIVRDVLDRHELPRSEYKDGTSYTFVRLPSNMLSGMATAPFLVILKLDRVITISPHIEFSPKNIDVFLTTGTDRPASILVSVLAGAVSEYEKNVNKLEEKIINAKKRLRQHDVQNADFVEFVTIEDRLNEYRSSLEGIAGVARQLGADRHKLFRPRDIESLEDIGLHIEQLLVSIVASGQTISSIQSAYSTIANNVLNQRMKLLTAITILLAIPNVFYGMYGMNIALPFQNEPWAYPIIASFTLLLILLVFMIARRYRLF